MPQPRRDDDEDWVGTPPEGRHTRDQADPGHWANQWQTAAAGGAALLVLLVIVAVLILL
jgi:hypothetical protein